MACYALLPRTRLYCSDCGENVGTERITNLICSRKLGGCESASIFHGTRSTQRQGDKRSAAADLIASPAPLRTRRHKARQNGPKHYPQGIQGDRNPLGTPFSPIFRRATKDGATGGRRMSRAVGKHVKSKTPPPEVVGLVERPVKTHPPKQKPNALQPPLQRVCPVILHPAQLQRTAASRPMR